MSYRLRRLKYAFQDNPRQGVLIILMILAALVAGWWFGLRDSSPSFDAPELTFAAPGTADAVVGFYARTAGERGLTFGKRGPRATIVVPGNCPGCAQLFASDLPLIIARLTKTGKARVTISPAISNEDEARVIAAATAQGRGVSTLARMAIEGSSARDAAASVPGMDMAKLDAALDTPAVTTRARAMTTSTAFGPPVMIVRSRAGERVLNYPFSSEDVRFALK